MAIALSYLIIFIILVYLGYQLRQTLLRDRNAVVPLLVLIPKHRNKKIKNHTKDDIALTGQLYSRLLDIKIPFAIEAVVENIGEEIKFLIFVSRRHKNRVRGLIKSLFEGAEAPEVDYYNLFSAVTTDEDPTIGKHTLVGYLSQTKPYLNPLTTSSDTFSKILHSLTNLKTIGEAVSIQWIVRPAHPKIKFAISKNINQIVSGQIPTSKIQPDLIINKNTLRLLEEKISAPLAATNCRIVVHTPDPAQTSATFDNLSQILARSHTQENLNQVALHKFKNQSQGLYQLLNHQFKSEIELILNTRELATIFHLPGQDTTISKVKRD